MNFLKAIYRHFQYQKPVTVRDQGPIGLLSFTFFQILRGRLLKSRIENSNDLKDEQHYLDPKV